jgi:hypothetical protein
MLHKSRQNYLKSKSANTMMMVVMMALVLTAAAITIIIFGNNWKKTSQFDAECVAQGGVCVSVVDCGACKNLQECKDKGFMAYSCKQKDNSGGIMGAVVCCPKEYSLEIKS